MALCDGWGSGSQLYKVVVSGVVPLAEHALSEWAIQGISPATSESSAAQRLSDLAASLDKQGAQPSLPAAVKERLSLAIALAKAPAAYGNESIRKTIDEHAALSARLPKLPGISEATQQAYLVQYVQERAAAHLKNYYEEDQLDSAEEYQRAIAILLATLEVDSADPGAINAKLLEIHRGTSSPSSPDKPENSAPENQAGAAEWSQERFESFVESLKTLNAKNYGKWPRDIRELADLIWTAAKDNKDSELRLTPERIAAQLFQESKFDPKAVSHVGAKGLAQGMPDTWEAYGKGSPYNPKDAVAFMVNYMNVVYKVVKEKGYTGEKAYLMTLAGYNAGPGRVSERGENLLTDSHWGRGETYNYVRKIPEYVRIIEKTMLPAAETPRPEARTAEVGSEQQNLLEQKLAEKAKDFAWEDGRKADEPKSTYKVEDQEQNAKNRDCGRLVARVLRESGVDENYESSGTPDQEDYVKAHPDKYQNIENTQSTEGLRPGDIFIVGNGYGGKGHTFIYVGEGKIAVASLGHYYPKIGNVYFKDHRGAYRIYRPIASTLLGSSTATP